MRLAHFSTRGHGQAACRATARDPRVLPRACARPRRGGSVFGCPAPLRGGSRRAAARTSGRLERAAKWGGSPPGCLGAADAVASGLVLALVRLVVFALVASLGVASGAQAFAPKPALRAFSLSSQGASGERASNAAEGVGKIGLSARFPRRSISFNRFRYYDPESGQYASQDPIGLAGGLGLHAYVHDPLSWVDPFGLSGDACSPPLHADELRGKTRTEVAELASRKGLIPTGAPDVASGLPRKWKDPATGKQRLRLDRGHVTDEGVPFDLPRAAADHVHGYEPDGITKIRDPHAGNDPHFPTTGE